MEADSSVRRARVLELAKIELEYSPTMLEWILDSRDSDRVPAVVGISVKLLPKETFNQIKEVG